LEIWATHIAYVEDGKLKRAERLSELPELHPPSTAKNLIQVVEPWLRTERSEREKHRTTNAVKPDIVTRPADVSPWTSSRHMAYYR
jgi:CCR4-NOT complex subunit CAF16